MPQHIYKINIPIYPKQRNHCKHNPPYSDIVYENKVNKTHIKLESYNQE